MILSGGELTVTLRGKGPRRPEPGIRAGAGDRARRRRPASRRSPADTDGTDGGGGRPDDPAGAFIDRDHRGRARGLGLDPAAFLADNNSTEFFAATRRSADAGPTYTNVNDFRAILVDSP